MIKKIGIIGGGQLARMLNQAAAKLGLQTIIFCDKYSPACDNCSKYYINKYDDFDALLEFGKECDIVTIEFENIPFESLHFLENNNVRLSLDPNILKILSDRHLEKNFINKIILPEFQTEDLFGNDVFVTAPYIDNIDDNFQIFAEKYGFPLIFKSKKFGYDGKGQYKIDNAESYEKIFKNLSKEYFIIEAKINFKSEFSLLVNRSLQNEVSFYPIIENIHENGILSISTSNDETDERYKKILQKASEYGKLIIENANYYGVLAIEFFLLKDDKILINEIAPRVHNSGHLTIEGNVTSQFEQHIRAISGMPLGDVTRVNNCKMLNLIGDDINLSSKYLAMKNHSVHIYGKDKIVPGRKMGHVIIFE